MTALISACNERNVTNCSLLLLRGITESMRLLGGYGGVQGFFVISSTERNSDPKREYT